MFCYRIGSTAPATTLAPLTTVSPATTPAGAYHIEAIPIFHNSNVGCVVGRVLPSRQEERQLAQCQAWGAYQCIALARVQ